MTTRSFHRTMIRTRHMGAMYKHGFGYTTLTSQNSEEAREGQHEDNRNRRRATPSCRSSSPAEVPEVGRRNIALVYEFFANSRRAVQNVPWRFVVSGRRPFGNLPDVLENEVTRQFCYSTASIAKRYAGNR